MLQQLLRCLADGEFHSGQQLADVLDVSRSSVWNHLQNLHEYGLQVYSVRGKGYRLAEPLQLFDKAGLQQALPQSRLLSVTQSTNDWLLHHMAELPSGYLCIAEFQTHGRGRNAKSWQAPYGANLMFSKLWLFERWPADMAALSLVVGLMVVQALRQQGVRGVRLKWPNDVVWPDEQGRMHKLGGILVELRGEAAGAVRVVIGVGVNCAKTPVDVDQPVVSCADITQQALARQALLVAINKSLESGLDLFAKQGFAAFVDLWSAFDVLQGQSVRVTDGDVVVRGVAQGVDEHGALRVFVDGQTVTFASGEVSVRAVTSNQRSSN